MFDNLINTDFFPLVLLVLLGFSFLVQQLYYWLFFNRLESSSDTDRSNSPAQLQPVSVVICAHNEHHHLKDNLPAILAQEYPAFEVVVVNHASDDDTPYFLQTLRDQYAHLTVITIEKDFNFFTGKKFPLSIGIKSARHDRIILTDADCRPSSPHWIMHMQSAFRPGKEIVLGYSPYKRYPGLLNSLIRFDTLHIALQYLSFAARGFPYMGVGRNLAYRKQLFYRNNGFIAHYRIGSGDDDLFINQVATRTNTTLMIHPDSFTTSEPEKSMGKWITQKRRHLSTGLYYRTRHRILLGFYTSTTVTTYLFTILLLSLQWSFLPVIAMFALRLISQYIVFYRATGRLKERDLVPLLPLYELFMMMMNLGVVAANAVKKPVRWN
jgi:cellulose synthase/poly-beta-1,6-N-acetylglucosamine synthase-like glycosyltransferase